MANQTSPSNHVSYSITSQLPTTNRQITIDRINFRIFRQAIISGCKNYTEHRKKNTAPPFFDCGIFHGKKGLVKSQKVQNLAEKLQSTDKEALLLLALALYQSSSKWLTTEIAKLMITGDYEKSFSAYEGKLELKNTLNSSVFSQGSLDSTLHKEALRTNVASGSAFTFYVKRKAVRLILEQELNTRFPNTAEGQISKSRINFITQVQRLKSHLRDTENPSIEPCSNVLGISP